jgi:hypothetical protein
LTVNEGIKVLVHAVAKCLMPYPDPIHRRRLRRDAKALVSWTKWPGDDATTLDVAELALVRLLWLQREVHRAARSKQKEATALLARSAIETCITGMWCVYGEDTVARLRRQNARALDRMTKYLVGSLVTRDFLDRAVADIGEPIGPLDLATMIKVIIDKGGPPIATNLYERYYISASTLYAHGSGAAMLRHVGRAGALTEAPSSGWLRRSAVHVVDGCVAELAKIVATNSGRPAEVFVPYANAHLVRALPPIASMGGGDLFSSMRPRSFPRAFHGYRTVQRYLNSQSRQTDDSDTSEAVIRAAIVDMLSMIKRDGSNQTQSLLVEELVKQLSEYEPNVHARRARR